jgi:hypothetical protein
MTAHRSSPGRPGPHNFPVHRTTTKGVAVNAEQHGRTPSQSTGIFATLANLLRHRGSSAPSSLPVSSNPFAASGGDSVATSARTASAGPSSGRTQGGGVAALLARLRTLRCAAFMLSAAAVLVLGAAEASPAAAASPWWHLETSSRPTYINPNAGTPAIPGGPEVQEIHIVTEGFEGEGGQIFPQQADLTVKVAGVSVGEFATEQVANENGITLLSAANLRTALEAPYGANKVEVEQTAEGATIAFLITAPSGKVITAGGIVGQASTSVLQPGTPETPEVPDGEIYVTAEDVGNANVIANLTPVTLKDVLPPHLVAVGIGATEPEAQGNFNGRKPIVCNEANLSCEFKGELAAFDSLEMRIAVNVEPGFEGVVANQVTVSGGGVATKAITRPITVSTTPLPFGVHEFEMALEEEGGAPSTHAGAHPFQFTTQITLNQGRDLFPVTSQKPEVIPVALAKDVDFNLPPGLIGNPSKLTKCTTAQFFVTVNSIETHCPASSAVGVAVSTVHEPSVVNTVQIPEPIFNMEPNFGEPARFGFNVLIAGAPVFIDTAVRSEHGPGGGAPDYGVSAEVRNITQTAGFLSSTATFWGVPGAASHDKQRGWGCFFESRGEPGHSPCLPSNEQSPPVVFSNPTGCATPLQTSVDINSWDDRTFHNFPGTFSPSGNLTGCNQVPFGPEITAEPTTKTAAAPSGLSLDLNLKQNGLETAAGYTESDVKAVTVALPTGVTTNPAVANGLSACTLAQYQAETVNTQSCPESSKVGEVEIESPLVAPIIHGDVYVAKQHDNPANNLLSIYMVAKNPELGVMVRSAGAVTPNPQTGQLTTTFEELPQLPFTHFHFAFRTGQRAPLITPGLCGTYATQADLYPYSEPAVPVHRQATFTVNSGANGGPCAATESQLPNKPSLEAGTLTPIAGAYSPFVFKVRRADGSQPLSTISATLPEGLLGKLAGVKECSSAQIAQAEGRGGEGQGALELSSPSCPASSEVGVVNVGTGVGSQPYYVQGKAYLAGPYKGAPLSLAIITPAVVGPFDLGTIVVRTALYVNETTAQITAKSDPIPTIVHGLPTVVQSISLNMNRPSFTLNPTSCEPKQIEGQATSTLGNVAALQQRFQVGACNALGFKPSLKLSLKGATKRSGVPALKAVLTYPKGNYANIKSVSTVLPKSEFIDNAHIGNTCTRVQFNAGAGQGAQCPKNSLLGHAVAYSPLIDKPLEGNVYLRSNGGERELPDIVAALKGQIDVTLVGFIDSVRKSKHSEVSRIRTRFMNVPDAPVSRFVLQLAGAKKGLLQNSQNLCKVKNIAQVKATAQNGKIYDTEPAVANDCGKKHKKKSGKAGKGSGGK